MGSDLLLILTMQARLLRGGNSYDEIPVRLHKPIAATDLFTSHTLMTQPTVTSDRNAEGVCIRIAGDLRTQSLDLVEGTFKTLGPDGADVTVDLSGVQSMDTGGAWLIADLEQRIRAGGAQVRLEGARDAHASLIETVSENMPEEAGQQAPPRGLVESVARLGERTASAWQDTLSIIGFFGLTLHRLARTLIMPWRLRRAALVSQMEQTGFKALPIVSLMGFLIGVVLAFQGTTQMKQFGAEIFVVELISISILRELGILLTAIIVAGRSGSAFTASIGSMKVQEEIDAMRTLGLDPIEVLVVPRVLALLIMLPILGFVADMAGLIGGALMSWIDLGVSPGMFVTRLKENTDVWQLAIGLIKAPFFALVIGVVACWQAMQVKGSSESVGQRTTASVVQSIFMVIAIDAMFSIFFSELGI